MELINDAERKYLKFTLFIPLILTGLMAIGQYLSIETKVDPTFNTTTNRPSEFFFYIYFILTSAFYGIEAYLKGNKLLTFLIPGILLAVMITSYLTKGAAFDFMPWYLMSGYVLYGLLRYFIFKNPKVILSGLLSGFAIVGFMMVNHRGFIDWICELGFDILPFDIEFYTQHIITNFFESSVLFISYFFFLWLSDKIVLGGKDMFNQLTSLNTPFRVTNKKDYIYLWTIGYTILLVLLFAYRKISTEPMLMPTEVIKWDILILAFVPSIFLIVTALFLSKLNFNFILHSRRAPHIYNWMMLLPFINIIFLIILNNHKILAQRGEKIYLERIKSNQSNFIAIFIILQVISIIGSFLMLDSSQVINISFINGIILVILYVILSAGPNHLPMVLIFLLVSLIGISFIFDQSIFIALTLFVTGATSLSYFRNAFQPFSAKVYSLYYNENHTHVEEKIGREDILDDIV